ncbi:MAG: terminase small subunit [Planctomycetota bacterium]|jgi:hypothetical protein
MATKTQVMTFNRLEFIRHLFDPDVDFNATEAYRRAYPKCKGGHNRMANRLMSCDVIKQEIAKKRAEIEKKFNIDRDYCIQKTREILENSENERNKLTAVSLLGDFIGAKRENAPNSEREAAKRRKMDDESRRLAEELARLLTRKTVASKEIA